VIVKWTVTSRGLAEGGGCARLNHLFGKPLRLCHKRRASLFRLACQGASKLPTHLPSLEQPEGQVEMQRVSGYVGFYDRAAADVLQSAELRLLEYAELCIASSQSDNRGKDELAWLLCPCMTSDLVSTDARRSTVYWTVPGAQ
jgi:hypothetical protein